MPGKQNILLTFLKFQEYCVLWTVNSVPKVVFKLNNRTNRFGCKMSTGSKIWGCRLNIVTSEIIHQNNFIGLYLLGFTCINALFNVCQIAS